MITNDNDPSVSTWDQSVTQYLKKHPQVQPNFESLPDNNWITPEPKVVTTYHTMGSDGLGGDHD